jgi:hypothetical protein
MTTIKQFLQDNKPFSVMQYFESFKGNKTETKKAYEIIYLNLENKLSFKILNKGDIIFLKENLSKFKNIIKNKEGSIYEFNNFKEYKEKNCLKVN